MARAVRSHYSNPLSKAMAKKVVAKVLNPEPRDSAAELSLLLQLAGAVSCLPQSRRLAVGTVADLENIAIPRVGFQ